MSSSTRAPFGNRDRRGTLKVRHGSIGRQCSPSVAESSCKTAPKARLSTQQPSANFLGTRESGALGFWRRVAPAAIIASGAFAGHRRASGRGRGEKQIWERLSRSASASERPWKDAFRGRKNAGESPPN